MNQSETITKLADALVKAQAAMPEIPMDGMNPHFGNKFSTLGAVIKAVRPVFSKYGLAVMQLPTGSNNEVGLTTRIVHTSGEWIEGELKMQVPNSANPGQEIGKLVTYLRRYSLASMAGVYSDEDTDNEPTQKNTKKTEKQNLAELGYDEASENDKTVLVQVMSGDTINKLVELEIFEATQAAAQVMSQLFKGKKKAPWGKIEQAARTYRSNKIEFGDTDAAIEATLSAMEKEGK